MRRALFYMIVAVVSVTSVFMVGCSKSSQKRTATSDTTALPTAQIDTTFASPQEGGSQPVAISWKVAPAESGKISDAPDLLYKRPRARSPENVEVVMEFEVMQQPATEFGTQTLATGTGKPITLRDEAGEILAKDWTEPVRTFLAFFVKAEGKSQLRVALFRARTDKNMPKECISNWITMPLTF